MLGWYIRSRRRWVAAAAIAASGAAAAYYVYDRCGSCKAITEVPVLLLTSMRCFVQMGKAEGGSSDSGTASRKVLFACHNQQHTIQPVVQENWGRHRMLKCCVFYRDEDTALLVEPANVTPPPLSATDSAAVSAATIQQDADCHLTAHYESVQGISTTTTTPSLLPMLLQSLVRNTDYKPLLDELR